MYGQLWADPFKCLQNIHRYSAFRLRLLIQLRNDGKKVFQQKTESYEKKEAIPFHFNALRTYYQPIADMLSNSYNTQLEYIHNNKKSHHHHRRRRPTTLWHHDTLIVEIVVVLYNIYEISVVPIKTRSRKHLSSLRSATYICDILDHNKDILRSFEQSICLLGSIVIGK
ncbi:hypothetical protein FF38_00544 [Lucilia cuprina]|uniref:Uncharacterized protein n=1 Tax=Lucilia cuprina TaxID=7375 RepID=A0A0L0CKN2_LUCCU|nr:hypothetical protein FF38_00544 [Lucilia cuprina]